MVHSLPLPYMVHSLPLPYMVHVRALQKSDRHVYLLDGLCVCTKRKRGTEGFRLKEVVSMRKAKLIDIEEAEGMCVCAEGMCVCAEGMCVQKVCVVRVCAEGMCGQRFIS